MRELPPGDAAGGTRALRRSFGHNPPPPRVLELTRWLDCFGSEQFVSSELPRYHR